MNFSEQDLLQIRERGSDVATTEEQIEHFRQGFPFMDILKPATLGAGIVPDRPDSLEAYIQKYRSAPLKAVKFVPASGAASRMFKELFAFQDEYQDGEAIGSKAIQKFFTELSKFAFYEDLEEAHGGWLPDAIKEKKYVEILQALLSEEGLNYGGLPKGLLKFHRYLDDTSRTPVEEHLMEGANYAQNVQKVVHLHFTVSPEHQAKFEEHIRAVSSKYEEKFGVTFGIEFSEQKPSTDTIAVDMENLPFRQKDGSLLFRPGGHGALIENLNDIDADLIFIKNIDNVVPDNLKPITYDYKKALAGVALRYQELIFGYLERLEMPANENLINELQDFFENDLCILPPTDFDSRTITEKVDYFRTKLNRPIRACGMVRNEGEPGGGPFWTKETDGTVSLQIVETAQIDTKNPEKKAIMEKSTHFNPVDLVCLVKDYQGNKFDLISFRDPQTGFISYKSSDGKDLKAQELPGLWNGAMANWNTIFLEVPILTFNPVKTVNDLLKPQHQ